MTLALVGMRRRFASPVTRKLLAYVAVGGLAALLYVAVALTASSRFGVSPQWASIGGYLSAMPCSYLGHKLLTFRSAGRHQDELPRFVTAAVAAILLSVAAPAVIVQRWHAGPLAGYLAVCVAVPALNYLSLRFWVFVRPRAVAVCQPRASHDGPMAPGSSDR